MRYKAKQSKGSKVKKSKVRRSRVRRSDRSSKRLYRRFRAVVFPPAPPSTGRRRRFAQVNHTHHSDFLIGDYEKYIEIIINTEDKNDRFSDLVKKLKDSGLVSCKAIQKLENGESLELSIHEDPPSFKKIDFEAIVNMITKYTIYTDDETQQFIPLELPRAFTLPAPVSRTRSLSPVSSTQRANGNDDLRPHSV